MGNIKILDCTLRDGGRIIDCKFTDNVIAELTKELTEANIDIVEMGFLRDNKLVQYHGNSTFFTETSQLSAFLPANKRNTMYTAFIDFDMYDFSRMEKCDGSSVTGIRVGFTKKQFLQQHAELRKSLFKVKEQGYALFMQGVNTLAYSDRELLDVLDLVNEVEPYSYGIVDTYGGMYLDDMVHLYNLVEHNLNPDICIDIHSHNNFQLSFAFAQEIIRLAGDKRQIILDATLNGMGKCAGNLNTELIVDFLVRKKSYDYDTDIILDAIDRYLYPIKKTNEWGYSIPAFMAGIYKAHPNNIIYLTEKYRLNSKDMKYIISGIEGETRQRYDYENIQRVYKEYCASRIDDTQAVSTLRSQLENRHILILAPGKSTEDFHEKICNFIEQEAPIVISVNFIPRQIECDYLFYANTIHWEKISDHIDRSKCILASNIHTDTESTLLVDYSGLIMEDSFLYDNSTIMLLNLLKKVDVAQVSLAGFDGLRENEENYVDDTFPNQPSDVNIVKTNKEVRRLLEQYKNKVAGKIGINFLTPSIYETS